MSVWSNIALCAQFMFNRLDPGFHDRAKNWHGGIIVGGDNYGQGSSREHAALIPMHLGVRLVAAKSYARIHRRNLIAVGIAPLILPAGAPPSTVGEEWTVTGLRDALVGGASEVVVDVSGRSAPLALQLDFTPGERDILAAGGLLAHIRQGGRVPV